MQQTFNEYKDRFRKQQDTPQVEQYEDASQEQPTLQHDTITHEEQQKTLTIQNLSDPSGVTTDKQSSITITTGSNSLDIPFGQIPEHEHNNHNQDDTSTLSTSNTNTTQPLSFQQASPRNCEPPTVPAQYSAHTTPHSSPQRGSSICITTIKIQNPPEIEVQTNTPTSQSHH